MRSVQAGASQFFAHEAAAKERCVDRSFHYVGYVHRPIFEKELFQVRLGKHANHQTRLNRVVCLSCRLSV